MWRENEGERRAKEESERELVEIWREREIEYLTVLEEER